MVNAAEVRTGGEIGPRHPGIRRVPGVPVAPTVLSMLQSARRGLDEAADETSPGARYVTAHLAALRAAAFCSSVAATIPRIFFWFGQMIAHTLNNMMVPSQAPVPITRR